MDWEEAKELKDLRARLAECERRREALRKAAREALDIMAPRPPEPWPDYAAAVSILAAALAEGE